MSRTWPVAAALALAFPATARAAAPAAGNGADCVSSRLSAVDRAALIDGMVGAENEERPPARDPLDILLPAASACARTLGWSEAEAARHTLRSFVEVAVAEMAAALARGGVAPAAIERWFVAQTDQVRTGNGSNETDRASLAAALQRDGIAGAAIARNGATIGNYLDARISLERLRRGLD